MFAATVVARYAQRLRVAIDHDHGMHPIFVALPAVILNRLADRIEFNT
jgi:hypothetical protein